MGTDDAISERRHTGADRSGLPNWDIRSPAEPVTADRLWAALDQARSANMPRTLATTEDAVFRLYLPMARTLAHAVTDRPVEQSAAEQAAELGLAHAVLAWRQRASDGFRGFARAAIQRQLDNLTSRTTATPARSSAVS